MPRPDQDPSFSCPQGECMARAGQVLGTGGGVQDGLDGGRPVPGRNAGGGVVLGVHRNGEGSAVLGGVVLDHEGYLKLVQPLPDDGHADKAPGMPGHEVDGLGGDLFCGYGQVSLILAVVVVHDDEKVAFPDLFYSFFDSGKGHFLTPAQNPGGKGTPGLSLSFPGTSPHTCPRCPLPGSPCPRASSGPGWCSP